MEFSIIEIKIESNFGNKFFTSIHKIGVHGQMNSFMTSADEKSLT